MLASALGWDGAATFSQNPHKGLQVTLFVLAGLLLVGLALKIYLPISPAFAFPDRDSGVFLYTGRQVLDGKIPYRDVWDHKGPFIFYLNALGLMLTNGSAWGVWTLELVWVLVSVLSLFLLLREATADIPAVIGSLIFLLGLLQALDGGNFTEEYGLLF
jgi:hypothetical protein